MRFVTFLLALLLLTSSLAFSSSGDGLSDHTITALLYRTKVSTPGGLTAEDIAIVLEWAEAIDTLPRFHRVLLNLVVDGRASILVQATESGRTITFVMVPPPTPPDG